MLHEAATLSPVQPVAGMLRARAREFHTAALRFDEAVGDEYTPTIMPMGSLEAGMSIYVHGAAEVLRVIVRPGDSAVQLHEVDAVRWENFTGANAPVVVISS